MSEDITTTTLPDGSPNPAGGEVAASQEAKPIHQILSEALGKEFQDDDSALKSVKDTYKDVGFVGPLKATMSQLKERFGVTDDKAVLDRMEELIKPVDNATAEVKELKAWKDETEFYSQHEDLKPFSGLLNELRGSTGKPLAEVAESQSFKDVIQKAKAADEIANTRSVLESNPRLGKVRDKIQDAYKLSAEGNQAGADKVALSAVMDLMNE